MIQRSKRTILNAAAPEANGNGKHSAAGILGAESQPAKGATFKGLNVADGSPAFPPDDEVLRIHLSSIQPSPLNPRKIFDETGLLELARSIKEIGVQDPVKVREHAARDAKPGYELIDGERRVRAARMAGLAVIPAIVRKLTDAQVRIAMLVSFDLKVDLPPLEKADGYHELTKLGVSPEEIARQVGKSPSTIHGLLKLRRLPEVARKFLQSGELALVTAQAIARIPNSALLEKATHAILRGDHRLDLKAAPGKIPADAEPLDYRQAKSLIEHYCSVELKGAPFDRKALDLIPAAGSCDKCPKRVGNLQLIEPEVYKGVRADVCTDPECFRAEIAAHDDRRVEQAKQLGATVLPKAESEKLFPYGHLAQGAGFYDLAEICYEAKGQKTYRQLLGPHLRPEQLTLVHDREGKLHEIVAKTHAVPILKDKHQIGTGQPRVKTAAEKAEEERRRLESKIEAEATRQYLEAVFAAGVKMSSSHYQHLLRFLCAYALSRMPYSSRETQKQIVDRRGPEFRAGGVRALHDALPGMDGGALMGLLLELTLADDMLGFPEVEGADKLAEALKLPEFEDLKAKLIQQQAKPAKDGASAKPQAAAKRAAKARPK